MKRISKIDSMRELVRSGLPRQRAQGFGVDPEAPELLQAESEFVAHCLAKINAGGRDWRAYAWMLETRFPEDFGHNKDAAPVDLPDGGFIDALNDTAEKIFNEVDHGEKE